MWTTGAQFTVHVRPLTLSFSLLSSSSSFSFVTTILLLVCSCILDHNNVVMGQEAEADILRRFKAGLANAGGPVLVNWDTNPGSPCPGGWIGVLCFDRQVYGLKLEGMGLSGRIDVDALVPLRSLRTLSFMNNSFEGVMPDWRKLGALKSLYASYNKFSGDIPNDAFRGMTSLKKIHVANNRFTGRIPSSLSSQKLIELRLENNQFSGRIPEISLEHLKVFNVSNNQLEGPIPVEFQKLDPSSFAGNKGLCGEILQNPCPTKANPVVTTDDSSKKSPAKIVLIAAAALLGLLLLILLIICILCQSKKQKPKPKATPSAAKGANAAATAAANAATTTAAAGNKRGNQSAAGAGAGAGAGQGQAGRLTFVNEERRTFDLQDLMRASAEVLGSGNFGASYKAVLVEGEAIVVKRFKQMNNVAKEDFHEHMRRLGRLNHHNLLPLVAYLYRKEEKLLVFDFINNCSLAKHLHGKHSDDHPRLSWPIRLKIIKGVAKGLMYLHNELPSLTVPHAHLKSSNVLLDESFNPLLMDYTLSPIVNPGQVHQILVAYKSPEYANQFRVTRKTDTWCLGILMLEILTGKFVIAQGCGNQSVDLAGWIHAIVQEVNKDSKHAFDKEMRIIGLPEESKYMTEMDKLLKIGIACCEEDLDKRLELEEAVKQIEQIQESSA